MFYDLLVKLCSVRLVELFLFELRGLIYVLRLIAAAGEQDDDAAGKKYSAH